MTPDDMIPLSDLKEGDVLTIEGRRFTVEGPVVDVYYPLVNVCVIADDGDRKVLSGVGGFPRSSVRFRESNKPEK